MPRAAQPPAVSERHDWTFLSNHAHVLIVLAAQPDLRMRDVAVRVGITERAVQRIVADLAEGGYLEAIRDGRRNRYRINRQLKLRHPVEAHRTIEDLIELGR
jgi:DNA-binding IclR family transcriptional regulator